MTLNEKGLTVLSLGLICGLFSLALFAQHRIERIEWQIVGIQKVLETHHKEQP